MTDSRVTGDRHPRTRAYTLARFGMQSTPLRVAFEDEVVDVRRRHHHDGKGVEGVVGRRRSALHHLRWRRRRVTWLCGVTVMQRRSKASLGQTLQGAQLLR